MTTKPDSIIDATATAMRAAVESYLKRGDTQVRDWLEEELRSMKTLFAHAQAVSGAVDAATQPADFVQVGEFTARDPDGRVKPGDRANVFVRQLSFSDPAQIGYGYSMRGCYLEPFASGVAASEAVRAMSGDGRGLREGKRYRVLIMAWEQTDEKKE